MPQIENRLLNHLKGNTQYIDDIQLPPDGLLGFVIHSPYSHAQILSIDTTQASQIEGIKAILTSKDIPGTNNMGSIKADEPILAEKEVKCVGQAVVLIAATTRKAAETALPLIKVKYKELEPLLDLEKSYSEKAFPFEPYHLKKGNVKATLKKSPNYLKGNIHIGGQEHFYLETQGGYTHFREDGILHVRASTQNPSETQLLISKALNTDISHIEVETGCLGGAFGGKETQGSWCSIWASLLTYHTGKPVKLVLSRDQDMLITGKRHPVKASYEIGFTNEGIITAYKVRYLFNIGCATDLSQAICERCFFHSDNAYYIPKIEIEIYPCPTNTASNCAFRGFGAPQGIALIEHALDCIANKLHKDPFTIRKRNFYGIRKRNITPYGERVSDNSLPYIYERIIKSSDYKKRVQEIKKFNTKNKYIKRAISATPVKFGISFTTSHLNQGSAIVNIYRDGSVIIHQGGVEMGQGLYEKIETIASKELKVEKEKIKIYNTNTSIIPNTSATAASTGSDINGQAALIAIRRISSRLKKVEKGMKGNPTFNEIVEQAYRSQINLAEKAFWHTPGIYFNRKTCKGHPFFYYVCGIGISEIELDTLTGEIQILRTDIVHDTGISIDPEIDISQIQGAYIQGAGWCTMEELLWNEKGYPIASNADCYKIPGIADIPRQFNITLYQENPFYKGIFNSRAIREPPFIYGLSVWSAIKKAIKEYNPESKNDIDIPATKENIILTINNK